MDPGYYAVAIGRALLGALYVVAGLRHYWALGTITDALRSRKIPLPRLACHVATVFQIVCGALLIIGIEVRWAAYGLVVFTVITTIVMVDFWRMSGDQRANGLNIFLAHLGVLGGLLLAATQD